MKNRISFLLVIFLVGIFIIAGCATAPPASAPPSKQPTATTTEPAGDKVIALKLGYHHPPQSVLAKQVFTPWTQSIEKASNGKVKITHFAGETLNKMKDEYDAVLLGLADISTFSAAVTPGRFPMCEIDLLPMIFPNAEIAARVHHELLEKYCVSTELSKVKFLLDVSLPPMQLFTTKPIQKLEDLKGLKMRVEGKVETWTMEALGATALQLGMGELYSALERGLVEGVAMAYQGVLAYGFQQVTKYRTTCDLFTRNFPVVMNLETWNKLPPDIQKVFLENSGSLTSASYGAVSDKIVAGAIQGIAAYDKKAGNPEFFKLSADEKAKWQQAVSVVWDRWLDEMKTKGLPGQAMIDDAKRLVKQYSK